MNFGILGPLEVTDGGLPIPIPRARERQLLTLLAVSPGQVVSADRLVEELWGVDLPRDPTNALQAAISRLRKALGPRGSELVVTRPPGYVLQVGAECVDARRFERLVAEGRRRRADQPAAAARQLTDALALWRGPPLAELSDTDSGRTEAARLEELRLGAEEDRMDALLATGHHAAVVGELEGLVRAHPLRERRWGQLMLALYRSGRQAEALRAYQGARRVLGDELGLAPSPDLGRLESAILAQDPSLSPPTVEPVAAAVRHNLPAPATSFVGRWREQREVGKLLDDHRLVTLTGPGGVGKTRLALEVTARRLEERRGGVWMVELGGLAEGSLVVPAVAAAVGLRESGMAADPRSLWDRLIDRLAVSDILLVLDGCEHLIQACAALAARVLAAAPGTSIVATSREPLNVAGEAQYPVLPLAFPSSPTPVEALVGYDAVRLFIERGDAVHPGFSLDADTAGAVTEICMRLDGIPLALELAAARLRALPVGEIAARLDDRFRLLTSGRRDAPPRQQTLRAALDWSHELLPEPEAVVFRRLSLFAGSFGVEAAEAVSGGDPVREEDVVDVLANLVDRSLVVAEGGVDARFRMLETVREYGRQRLVQAGEADEVGRRHAAFFLRLAEEAERVQRTTKGGARTSRLRLERELDDLRAAIDGSLARGDTETSLRLAGALGWFWFATRPGEGTVWLDAVLSAADPAPTWARARALHAAALVEVWPLTERSLPRAAESLAIFEQLGDASEAALSKVLLGGGLSGIGRVEEGTRLLAEAEETFRRLGDRYLEAVAWRVDSFVSVMRGDLDRAVELIRKSLERFREFDDGWGISSGLYQLGMIVRLQRDPERATALLGEALSVARERELWDNVHHALNELGNLAAQTGDHRRAAELHEEALAAARFTNSQASLALTYNSMGTAARLRGDLSRARQLYGQAAAAARDIGGTGELVSALISAGVVEELRGDLDAAEVCHRDALDVAARSGDSVGMALALEGLAGVVAARGDAEQAALLLGAAAAGREGAGFRLQLQGEPIDAKGAADTVRAGLGESAFKEVFERGRALGLEAVAQSTLTHTRGGGQSSQS